MLRHRLLLTLALPAAVTGCHSGTRVGPAPWGVPAERSIESMQAEFDLLQAQHEAKCRYAPAAQIAANRAICEQERERIAPLGNALMQAKVDAAKHATNP